MTKEEKYYEALEEIHKICTGTDELNWKNYDAKAQECDQALTDIMSVCEEHGVS